MRIPIDYRVSHYKPFLPSKIIQVLHNLSAERQIPSKGLNINQMAYAMREFGFGTRIYSRKDYKTEFEGLLSCYVESGLPLIVAMDNSLRSNTISHALLSIGHERMEESHIETIPPNYLDRGITFFDYAKVQRDYIFIDDNRQTYQRAKLTKPASHYPTRWHDCEISYFIVPLYPKIYLEAAEAKNFVLDFLVKGFAPMSNGAVFVMRFFLTSSRSYKDKIARNNSIQNELKAFVIETSMPKFIWVAELSTKDLIKQKKANGLVILDATEADIYDNKPLILAIYENKMIKFDEKHRDLEMFPLYLREFSIFEHNLQEF